MINVFLINIFDVFTTREVVIIIWFFIFILIVSILVMTKPDIRKSFDDIINQLFSSYIMVPFLLITIYSLLLTIIFINFSFWKNIYLKDLIIWFLFSGIASIFKSVTSKSFTKYYRDYVLNQFKIIIIVQFIINTFTFDFWIEMALVPFITFISLLNVVVEYKADNKKLKSYLNIIIVSIGWIILVFTIMDIYNRLEKIDVTALIITFILPIILSLLFFPLAYVFALYTIYEKSLNIVMHLLPDDHYLKRQIKYKIFLACHFSLNKIEYFFKNYSRRFYRNMSEIEIEEIFIEFKKNIKN